MSEINVNTIDKATGSTLNVGAAGTTVNIAGTAGTGFPASGAALTGSTNNTVTTVTGANAIQGEANLLFDGNEMTVQGTPVVVGTNSSAVLDLKNTASSADGTAVGIAFSTNTGGSANAHITAVQDANAKGTLNFGGYDGTSTRNIVMSVDAGNSIVKVTGSDGTTSQSANTTYDDIVIDNNGSSGISFLGSSSANQQIRFDHSGSNRGVISYNQSSHYMTFGTDGSDRFRINHEGNIFIQSTFGTPSSSVAGWRFSPNGSSLQGASGTGGHGVFTFFNGNGEVGSISTSGSATSFQTSSDYRLKENVNYDFDATTRLKQLKPARFNFIADPDETVDGFIAHEVETIIPEAISGVKDATETYKDEDGNDQTKIKPQGIDQSKLVPLLTKALQEAITKIETLETKVTALENA
jgi:hypothetical protein